MFIVILLLKKGLFMKKYLLISIICINFIKGMSFRYETLTLPPLIEAVFSKNEERVYTLVKEGADLRQTDYHGQTACMYAVKANLQHILPLVSSQEIIDMQDSNGSNVLMYAAAVTSEAYSLIRDVLKYYPNLNLQDRWGETALMIVINKNLLMAELLLDNGANPNIQNVRNETALMITVQWNNYPGALLLLEHGANKHLVNEKGKTALTLAEEHTHYNKAMINLLRSFKS